MEQTPTKIYKQEKMSTKTDSNIIKISYKIKNKKQVLNRGLLLQTFKEFFVNLRNINEKQISKRVIDTSRKGKQLNDLYYNNKIEFLKINTSFL